MTTGEIFIVSSYFCLLAAVYCVGKSRMLLKKSCIEITGSPINSSDLKAYIRRYETDSESMLKRIFKEDYALFKDSHYYATLQKLQKRKRIFVGLTVITGIFGFLFSIVFEMILV